MVERGMLGAFRHVVLGPQPHAAKTGLFDLRIDTPQGKIVCNVKYSFPKLNHSNPSRAPLNIPAVCHNSGRNKVISPAHACRTT